MKRYFQFVVLLGLVLILLTGCMKGLVIPENNSNPPGVEESSIDENITGDSTTDGGSTGKGTLKIYLTNTSGLYKVPPWLPEEEYQAINISISRIEGHIAGEEGEDNGYWETLKEWNPGYDVNLMDIEGVSVLLASLNLESHTYTQLRIFLSEEAELVLLRGEDEVTAPLPIPSSVQTGIKLNHPFEIIAGNITKLTIEFDAHQSVVRLGNGKYLMKPVIGLSSETYSTGDDLTELVGSVSGTVSHFVNNGGLLELEGIEGAEIELTGGAYLFDNTTTTSSDGSYSLANVPAGTYTLHMGSVFGDDTVADVVVTAGADTAVDIVLSSGGIAGVVKKEGSELLLEGAGVTVDLTGGDSYTGTGSTDEFGEFLIEPLPVGYYNLTISLTGYDTYTDTGETIQVVAGTVTDVGEIGLTLTSP